MADREHQGQQKQITLQDVFGYPPDNLEPRTNLMIRKSMPLVKFFPSVPAFAGGLDLFHLTTAWNEYTGLLAENDYFTPNSPGQGIKMAFLADNFPTDTFTNEYGENFLQKFTSATSEMASSLTQTLGAETVGEAWDNMSKGIASGGKFGEYISSGMNMMGDFASALKHGAGNMPVLGNVTSGGITLLDRLAAGSRIDFPMVWKSSGFQPSYSLTVRLYNPFPQSLEATRKFIIGPIVAIMLMGVPRAQDSQTYTWPFLHRIECPGIFHLDPGFISNITVVKGGDQQQISLQQRLSVVDIRIDIGSLYSSMLGSSSKVTSRRPTVRAYAKILQGELEVSTRESDNKNVGTGSNKEIIGNNRNIGLTEFGAGAFGETASLGTGRGIGRTNPGNKMSPKRAALATDAVGAVKTRVTAAAEKIYGELKKLNPFG